MDRYRGDIVADQHSSLLGRQSENRQVVKAFERYFCRSLEVDVAITPNDTGHNRVIQIRVTTQVDRIQESEFRIACE